MSSNFLVLSRGRSGSHLLMSLIDSHPHIHAEKMEVFFRGNGAPTKRFSPKIPSRLRDLSKDFRKNFRSRAKVESDIKILTDYIDDKANAIFNEQNGITAYGFKFFISQLESRYISSPIVSTSDFIKSLNNYKVIHLYRENIVRQALSVLIKRSKKLSAEVSQGNVIRINVEELERLINQLYRSFEKQKKITLPHDPLKISYEDDLLNSDKHQATADKVFEHLGFDSHTISTNQKKNSSALLDSYIENANDVKSLIEKYCPEIEEKYYT